MRQRLRRAALLGALAVAVVAAVYWLRSRDSTTTPTPERDAAAIAPPAMPVPATPEPIDAEAATPVAPPTTSTATAAIPPELEQRLVQQVARVVGDCTRPLPRGPRRGLAGEVVVAIRAHRLTVTRILLPEPEEALRRCIDERAAGVAIDAPDQPDLVDTSVHIAVPPL